MWCQILCMWLAGDLGIQVSQSSVPSTSTTGSAVANSRHMCQICQQVAQLYITLDSCYNVSLYCTYSIKMLMSNFAKYSYSERYEHIIVSGCLRYFLQWWGLTSPWLGGDGGVGENMQDTIRLSADWRLEWHNCQSVTDEPPGTGTDTFSVLVRFEYWSDRYPILVSAEQYSWGISRQRVVI